MLRRRKKSLNESLENEHTNTDGQPDTEGEAIPTPRRRPSFRSRTRSIPPAPSQNSSTLPLVLTILIPLVSYATGGDLLKEIVLLLFLIFYLHQLIKGTHPRSPLIASTNLSMHSPLGAISCSPIKTPPIRSTGVCRLSLRVFRHAFTVSIPPHTYRDPITSTYPRAHLSLPFHSLTTFRLPPSPLSHLFLWHFISILVLHNPLRVYIQLATMESSRGTVKRSHRNTS
jgi:hypothetical protein